MSAFGNLAKSLSDASVTITSSLLGIGQRPGFIASPSDPAPASAAAFPAVYAFGDSLTDAGNVAYLTRGITPVSPPYSDGRFSNGPVWVQDLSQNLGLPPVTASLTGGTDYAYGGAETGSTGAHTANATDLPSQVAQFEANTPSPPSNALYAVWIGSNDVRDIANQVTDPAIQQLDVAAAVQNEMGAINGLVAHGAHDIVVLNVPNLGETPYETARGPLAANIASSLASTYDKELANSLAALVASSAASVHLIDTYSLLDGVIANPGPYGFTNVTTPVWSGNLYDPHSGNLAATGADQNHYLFFDTIHPTAQAHALLASVVTQNLTGA